MSMEDVLETVIMTGVTVGVMKHTGLLDMDDDRNRNRKRKKHRENSFLDF